jgi:biopolymer transport protein ExbB
MYCFTGFFATLVVDRPSTGMYLLPDHALTNRMRFALGFLFLTASFIGKSQPFGYNYAKQITIQSSQVSGSADHADFPVLISVTDNDLRTTANGGRVTNASGYDIVFTSSDCLTLLDHQIESYSATTGTYVAWVRVPVLSISSNTVIQMYYANSSVVSSTSSTSVWDAGYRAVWHFNNSVNDYTSNANNLTDNSTSNLASGKVAQARDLNNSTNVTSNLAGQYLQLANGFFSGISNYTFEGWVFMDRANTNWERIFDFGQGTVVNFFLCPSSGTGASAQTRARITINNAANEQGPVSGNVNNTGSWVHWAVVLDNATSTMVLYRNGAAFATASGTVTNTPQNLEASTNNYLGRSQYAADHYIDAAFDEFRVSTTARSAGWVTTAYNNQNTPASFYTVSAETAAASLCGPLPVELYFFKASVDGQQVELNWTTLSELNNNYFTIERSSEGSSWDSLTSIDGAGTSMEKLNYSYVDSWPYGGRSYYRLRQTDYDGQTTYYNVVSVDVEQPGSFNVFFDTQTHELIIAYDDHSAGATISLYNSVGALIRVDTRYKHGAIAYNMAGLQPGVYIIRIYQNGKYMARKVLVKN